MKVTISVNGRRHAFDFAEQLNKLGYLNQLITSYPTFKVEEWNIPKKYIRSLLPIEIFKRTIEYLPGNYYEKLDLAQNNVFDSMVSKILPIDSDVFIGWSGTSLKTIRKAKSYNIMTVLKRASAHIVEQKKILKEEYDKFQIRPKLPNKNIIQKELKEYEETDYIDVPSSFVKRSFIKHGIAENKLINVPYGVNLSYFHPTEKEDSIFRIVYAGRLSIQKGSHYLLRAVKELNLTDFEMWHLGSIDDEMDGFIKRYRADNILFMGHKPQNELYKYYSQGSVFVMPSIQEGMAIVQLQAMACGLPLICTFNTGGEDLIDDGVQGFIIPTSNIDILKEKILFLYENRDLCKEMGQNAMVKISCGFTWKDYTKKMAAILVRLLAK